MNEIPVYLFTGFMDSGKTSLIKTPYLSRVLQKREKALSSAVKTAMQSLRMKNLKKIM